LIPNLEGKKTTLMIDIFLKRMKKTGDITNLE
jgi:hypothetical protein